MNFRPFYINCNDFFKLNVCQYNNICIFVNMKKTVVWILSGIMGISFLILLMLQMGYIREMNDMRRKQFEDAVTRSLHEVAHQLELQEAKRYLEDDIREMELNSNFGELSIGGMYTQTQSFTFQNGGFSYSQIIQGTAPSATMPSLQIPNTQPENGGDAISDRSKSLQQKQLEHYLANKSLVDEVIYTMLNTASLRPLSQRIDWQFLADELNDQLKSNGIEIPFHWVVVTANNGRVIRSCGCEDFNTDVLSNTWSQSVFRNDAPNRMGVIRVYFPTFDDYISKSKGLMLPSFLFIAILMITFGFTLFVVLRQRKVTEIKNDSINNMTHEFKTPISTISLAAQMLNDQSVAKSPQMFKHISGVINDETKRLRFQVEKVLQMSMFERQSNTMKLKEMDVDELINGVVNTFKLKVENIGGSIDARFETEDPFANVDEMHFTNVIFNLMDNAVKYKREDVALHLDVHTWNEPGKLMITIADNGVGIRKDDLKKIFEKFYRVHTGNRHDVKGFGLGLAYVKKVVLNHKGTIRAESELGQGTKFIITLPKIDE